MRAFLLLLCVLVTSSAWILPSRTEKSPPNHVNVDSRCHGGRSPLPSPTKRKKSSAVSFDDFPSQLSNTLRAFAIGSFLTLLPVQDEAWAAMSVQQTQSQSSLVFDSVSTTISARASSEDTAFLNEVWSLIDKYYIDRSFGGQDWSQVLVKYTQKLDSSPNTDSFKLVSEMVASLGDKYSRMLDPSQYAAIQKFDLIGVGVTLMPDANKQIIVGAPAIPGSAADKAGVGVGDWIVAVNGESTKGKTAFDIIDEINEAKDPSKVTMTILPAAHVGAQSISDYTREVTLERTVQKIGNPVRYKISEERPDGTKVGFIRILEFNSQVVPKLQEALQELSKAGSNAYVIDLRHNGGGAFQSAVEISSLFLKNRIATYVVDNSQTKLPFATAKNADPVVDSTAPLVIWLDSKSASASEVLAGSLHDNCRAVLMGDTSFGKGLIQAVYGLKNGAGLVLTVARYVTPAGTDIQGSGISPDISGHVAPPIPGLSTDTSGVDFADVRQRLSMCQVPPAL